MAVKPHGWAIERGLAADNPVRRVKFYRAATKRLRYLTEEEFSRLVEAASRVTRSPSYVEQSSWQSTRGYAATTCSGCNRPGSIG
jgi:hypothetical protein